MPRALLMTIFALVSVCALSAVEARAHPAWGIVVDRQHQVYFSDMETIWKVDARGKLSVFREGLSGRHTHELNIDEAGNLSGEDVAYEPSTRRWQVALWKMTPSGSFAYTLAPTYAPPNVSSIWKDRDGNTYLVARGDKPDEETLLLRRAANGRIDALVGSRKAAGAYRQVILSSVGGMAFAVDGALYFTEGANIRKLAPDAGVTMLAANLAVENRKQSPMRESTLTRLFGIAVDAQDDAFVADYGNRLVLKLTPDNKTVTLLNAEPPWSPTGVAFRDGDLYVLEFGFTPPSTYTPRVRKLSPDGKVTLLATLGDTEQSSAQDNKSDASATGASTNGASTNGEGASSLSPPVRSAPHALIYATVAVVFALALAAWLVRRRMSAPVLR